LRCTTFPTETLAVNNFRITLDANHNGIFFLKNLIDRFVLWKFMLIQAAMDAGCMGALGRTDSSPRHRYVVRGQWRKPQFAV
jgi:hypothetical protein